MEQFSYTIDPRFAESDALGYINHTSVPVWFEQARTPIFELFNPGLSMDTWNLILKKIEVDYRAQIFLGQPVEISTWIKSLGNSSLVVVHEARQNGELVARGDIVMVHFDYQAQAKATIPNDIRERLAPYTQA